MLGLLDCDKHEVGLYGKGGVHISVKYVAIYVYVIILKIQAII